MRRRAASLPGHHCRRSAAGTPSGSDNDVEEEARRALYRYFDPIAGGPGRDGWPFGRPVNVGEVYAVLQRVEGVEYVADARLFATDPITGQRGEATQRLELAPNSVVFSYEHLVRVDRS